MTDAERQTWLDGLKPGDQVAFRGGGYTTVWFILTVERRTVAHLVCRTQSGGEIRARTSNGDLVGSRGSIEPLTDRIRGEIRRANDLASLRLVRWDSLPNETISAVAALVRAAKQGEGGER